MDPQAVQTSAGLMMHPDTAESIIAFASIITAVATVALAVFGIRQLSQLRDQLKLQAKQIAIQGKRERKWRSIDVCDRLLTDPILHRTTQRIWEKTQCGTDYSNCDKNDHDIIALLNYLESIAIGIYQKIYVAKIVHDNLSEEIYKGVRAFILGEKGTIAGCTWTPTAGIYTEKDYPCLAKLYKEWFEEGKMPSYTDSDT
jgi:hypothetical protein